MTFIRRCVLSLIIAGAAALFSISLSSQSSPAVQEDTGINQCGDCHDALVKAFVESPHGKKGIELISNRTCEPCHGPGTDHIEEGGDISKIRSFKKLSNEDKAALCLQCHEKGRSMFWQGSLHEAEGFSCQNCHSIHSPKSGNFLLIETKEEDLCSSCHPQKKSQLYRSSHHPINEGKVTCSDCHNSHGTFADKLISNDSINEKCYECHAEKRGPFLWGHEPVIEDCTICHEPHGSNHPRLLKAKIPYLCQRCHSDPRHPGTLYDQSRITSNMLFNRSCTNCHALIHGSNHPSGRAFVR
ncbi:MAG: DmsE family decaheme c-type cytochrome [Candidatus Aminicenantales bacterium]